MTWCTRIASGLLVSLLWTVALASAQEPEPPLPEAPQVGGGGGTAVQRPDAAAYPQPDAGYVTDLADLLSRDQEERIERWLWQTESRTGVEIAVVTIDAMSDFPRAATGSIEAFAQGLFDAWGIGNLPDNDGVLLLVSEGDRKARIELGAGYGRSRDADAQAIMDSVIVPAFRGGDYAAGLTDGVRALMEEFAGVRVGVPWMLIAGAAAVPVLGAIAYSLFRSGKRGWGWVAVGFLIVLLLLVLRGAWEIMRHTPSSSSGSWSSGGFGGGFGGGFSGGGGATGSW